MVVAANTSPIRSVMNRITFDQNGNRTIVDSRIAFFKTLEWTEQEVQYSVKGQREARLSALGRYAAMLIRFVNQLGVVVHWVWSKGHSGVADTATPGIP